MYYHILIKNQVLCNVTQLIVIKFNYVMGKSREQRLITKEHIATHTNLIILFKQALYVMIKLFKSSTKLF